MNKTTGFAVETELQRLARLACRAIEKRNAVLDTDYDCDTDPDGIIAAADAAELAWNKARIAGVK